MIRRPRNAAAPGGPELESLRRAGADLARTADVAEAARTLLDAVGALLEVGFAALSFVSDDGREASGYLARTDGRDVEWWPEVRLDLAREPSGVASAVFDGAAGAVYDASESAGLAGVGAKSAAFLPLVADQRVIAVLSVATTDEFHAFSADELELLQAVASEATAALARARAAVALDEALRRERLLAAIGRRFRGEPNLEAALQAAVEGLGRALGAERCLVRIEGPGGESEESAEWRRQEVAHGDLVVVREPVLVLEQPAGVLAVHLAAGRRAGRSEQELLRAVAGELGFVVRLSRLLSDGRERLAQRSALLRAARALSSEPELPAVLHRLVEQLAELLGADVADCYLAAGDRDVLRCAAAHGLDRSVLGFEIPAVHGLAGLAIREGRALVGSGCDPRPDPVPHPAYDGLADAIRAPLRWGGEVRGVLGAGRRGGRRFDRGEGDLLESFAGLASLALRNAETYALSSRQARVQRGFFRIASTLDRSLSRTAALEAIAQVATEALGGASVALLARSGGRFRAVGGRELPPGLAERLEAGANAGAGAVVYAAAQGRMLVSPSLGGDERLPEEWRAAGRGALLAVPVAAPHGDGRDLVLALVFFVEERTFTEDDLELARHLAEAARGTLERAELFEAERSARSLAQRLTHAGRLLTSELDPAAVLDEVVVHAPELVHAEACAIRLLEGDDLVVTAAGGRDAAEALGSRSSAAAWLSGDVVQSGAPVALPAAGEDARLRGLDPLLGGGRVAYLGVPLAGPEGAPVGVLAVYASGPREWREEEVEALQALAATTSVALANAELYQRVALERERSVAILANIADGIVAVDRDGRIVLWNAAAERITGIAASDALGRTTPETLRRELASGEDAPAGNRLVQIARGREEVWLSLTEAAMHDPTGAVAGRIFAFRDSSSDRLLEQVKSDFVSTVSHELRTPLASIHGFAETLLRRDVVFDEQERQTFLAHIASESRRLTSIVDTLLNVARLDTGDLRVELADTDLGAILTQAIEGVGEERRDGHRFDVRFPSGPLSARADPTKLRQVCSILLDNAVRYSPGGGTVTVDVERKRGTVEVSVADEGIGIPQTDREQIFRKFYRGTEARERTGAGGSGLGLFIARGLVAAMGGRIWVTSNEEEGSRFSFELPAA